MPIQSRAQQLALSAAAPPLPATRDDLLAGLKNKQIRNLNDYVHDIVVQIWPDEEFQKLLEATHDVAAVEGRKVLDDAEAARRIRQYAIEHEIPMVNDQKTWSIVLAMNVVLRRFGQDRKSRRLAVHAGE